MIINKKPRNKIKNIQETYLHNEVLILNRSVPSLRVRLESRTQSYFFPCCFQKKKKLSLKFKYTLEQTNMVSSAFGWASHISIVKAWLCYGEGRSVTICICEYVKPKTILKPMDCNNHCFIRDCRTMFFTRSICNMRSAHYLQCSRCSVLVVEVVGRLDGAF